MYLTITKDNITYVDNAKISDSRCKITGITENLGRAYNHTVFDNIKFSVPLKIGDVNGDGKINTQDVTALAEILINKSTDKFGTADINDDGTISIMDEVELIKMLNQK